MKRGKTDISTIAPACTISLLERREGGARNIINSAETVEVIKEVFGPKKWNFRKVSFESYSSSILSQYMTLQSTMVQISTSGTGSHMSMFLPEGAVDIEIKFVPDLHNNRGICRVLPSTYCLDVDPPADFLEGKDFEELKWNDMMVDLDELRVALQKAHDHLYTRCQKGTGKSRSITSKERNQN